MANTQTARYCPLCERQLDEVKQGHYTCVEHGEWRSYGPRLLIQAPQVEQRTTPRLLLPWERAAVA